MQAGARRAGRDRAAPAVALEDGIAMPGGAFPLGHHVEKEALEALPERCTPWREGADGRPEESDDGGGTREADLGVGAARTHLHRRQHERSLGRRRRDRMARLLHLERPLDQVGEPADRDLLRAFDPGGLRVGVHDGEEDEGAGERQRTVAVRGRERRQLGEAAVEGEERAGLPQRAAEALAHVVGKRTHAEGAMEAELGDQAQQAPGLEVDALEGAHRGAQAGVELERVGGVGEEREALHGLRKRLGDGLPHGGRERRGSVPPRRRSRVRLRDAVGFVAREPLGGDGLRGPPGREARA